jgi:hypothetical protein
MGLLPSGVYLSRSPNSSSLLAYPLDVPPAGCAASVLGRGAVRHEGQYLGKTALRVFRRLQGLRPRENRPEYQNRVSVVATGLPLLGFHLLMVWTPTGVQSFRTVTVTLGNPLVRLWARPEAVSRASCDPRLHHL